MTRPRPVRTNPTAIVVASAATALVAVVAAGVPLPAGPNPGPPPSSPPGAAPRPAAVPTAGSAPEPATLGSIERVHRRGDVWMTGQPTASDLEIAARAGVRTVVNQRREGETPFDEASVCDRLDLRYETLGFRTPEEITDELLDRTRRTLLLAPRPILLHCSSGNRTAATWIAWRTLDEDVPLDEAVAEARSIGLRTQAYVPVIESYVRRRLAARASAPLRDNERWALEAALEDERGTQAFYRAVTDRFGTRPPFTNLAPAEGRHASIAARTMTQLGLDVPPPADGPAPAVPETWEDAVRASIRAERDNIALYDRLLPQMRNERIRAAFDRLRDRSLTRHLPALERALERSRGGAGRSGGRRGGGRGRGG